MYRDIACLYPVLIHTETHRGQCEWVPLEEGNGRDVDEDVLAGLSIEPFALHLNLNGLGGMLHNFHYHHFAQTADKADDPFY